MSDEPRLAGNSRVILAILTNQTHANSFGVVHGGVILHIADECGALAALKHVGGGKMVTAAIDSMTFLGTVNIGERLEFTAEVTYVGRTSIEARIDVRAELKGASQSRLVAVGFGVYVAMDDLDRPTPVPRLVSETEADRLRDEAARMRQTARVQRRQEVRSDD